MSTTDPVIDVRTLDEPPFPVISEALADLDPEATLTIRSDFEPEPLYDVLDDRGFDHEAERVDDEWRVAVEHA